MNSLEISISKIATAMTHKAIVLSTESPTSNEYVMHCKNTDTLEERLRLSSSIYNQDPE